MQPAGRVISSTLRAMTHQFTKQHRVKARALVTTEGQCPPLAVILRQGVGCRGYYGSERCLGRRLNGQRAPALHCGTPVRSDRSYHQSTLPLPFTTPLCAFLPRIPKGAAKLPGLSGSRKSDLQLFFQKGTLNLSRSWDLKKGFSPSRERLRNFSVFYERESEGESWRNESAPESHARDDGA